MSLTAPPLPTRFPCWCRAVYSWGGESKRDLGFMEGDLIECLNAGDGSWWTGRLRRDRRMVGSFPSNFVELLPDDFRPVVRSTSPLPPSNTPPKNTPQKSKTFRKPFEAYAKAPHYTTAKQPETYHPAAVAAVAAAATSARSRDTSAQSVVHGSVNNGSLRINAARGSAAMPRRQTSPLPYYSDESRAPSPGHQRMGSYQDVPQRMGSYQDIPRRMDSYQDLSQRMDSYHEQPLQQSLPPQPPQPVPQQPYYDQHATPLRQPSPSPIVPHHSLPSRQPSPAPPMPAPVYSQPPPTEQTVYQPYRANTEVQTATAEIPDSPPPPPPPHRHVLARNNSTASYDSHGFAPAETYDHDDGHTPHGGLERHGSNPSYTSYRTTGYLTPRAPSPCPPSPGIEDGRTPTPVREAMHSVYEQLDVLGMSQHDSKLSEPPADFDPWSPESFDMVHQQSARRLFQKEPTRPQTSLDAAFPPDEGYETYSGSANSSQDNENGTGVADEQPKLPQLSNYVERMESRLRSMHQKQEPQPQQQPFDDHSVDNDAPPPPPKSSLYARPKSSMGGSQFGETDNPVKQLRQRRSAYDLGRQVLNRTFTTKTTITNSSTNTESTNRSLMSGISAGGISATSAGSLARKNHSRAQSALDLREWDADRPESPFTGVTYHSSHASDHPNNAASHLRSKSQISFNSKNDDLPGLGGLTGIGGLIQPKQSPKKSNIFKKIIESAKTGVASSRGSIAMTGFGNTSSPGGSGYASGNSFSSDAARGTANFGGQNAAREMGLGGNTTSSVDWVQVRRDVNRSNSLSRIERNERRDRCQMLDYPALDPVDELYSTIQGDEDANGMPVAQPTDFGALNLSQVDKNSRFISGLPPMTTAISLATTYVCRPYRSDVQRLRAIFTWVAEKIVWEDDYDVDGPDHRIDTRRVIQTKRGCAEEYAVLVAEMCAAASLHCEVVRGYLKSPGDVPELGIMPRPNHWWNAVLVDNEWRIMDCCIASPSFPRRSTYSSGSGGSNAAESWWFLVQPSEACYTHIPEHHSQQHLCPPVAHEILQSLPCAGPPYFRNGLQLMDFNTSLLRIEDLEMVHVQLSVPEEVEVAAEVEVRALARDADGDLFESGDLLKKRALSQADWIGGGIKRYTIKALLPGDEGSGILKVYAGRRGLMHSVKDIPHPLALSLPVIHTGDNPPFEFVTRHPTPHAQRHDIYVVQPQCQRLALNNTFVFAIRQHPSSVGGATPALPSLQRALSPGPFGRPSSAMSMVSSVAGANALNGTFAAGSVSGSSNSSSSSSGTKKPAKLAIQTPGGKILRLMRKEERSKGNGIGVGGRSGGGFGDEETSEGGTWETIIKCSERGVWRGLVLADRTARWCVFAEWACE